MLYRYVRTERNVRGDNRGRCRSMCRHILEAERSSHRSRLSHRRKTTVKKYKSHTIVKRKIVEKKKKCKNQQKIGKKVGGQTGKNKKNKNKKKKNTEKI